MKFMLVFLDYLLWHYGKGIRSSFLLWKNLTAFLFNYFSIKSLFGNFFTPWRRLSDAYPKWYQFKDFFSTLISNALMRIVGVIIRSFVLFFGLLIIGVFIIFYPVALAVWLLIPPAIVFALILGIILIIFG